MGIRWRPARMESGGRRSRDAEAPKAALQEQRPPFCLDSFLKNLAMRLPYMCWDRKPALRRWPHLKPPSASLAGRLVLDIPSGLHPFAG